MANQAYYITIENKVLALNEAIGELQQALELEIKANDNDQLSPENYDVQGTLRININWLTKRLVATGRLIEAKADNKFYVS